MSNKSGSKAPANSDSNVPSNLGESQKVSENSSFGTNNSRYSLGGGARPSLGAVKAGRLSQANNEFTDSGKLSLSGRLSMSANDSRASLSRYLIQNFIFTINFETFRRSSTYGKQSLGGNSQSSVIGKDPRPIREKAFQLNCIKNLISFLAKSGYDKPISQKILTAPSTKDFQQIFKFLYSQIDPTYEFGKKFEDEVPGLLKGIKYPFAGDISKSSLLAVGSIHAWPSLLAMLNWLVELIMVIVYLLSVAFNFLVL